MKTDKRNQNKGSLTSRPPVVVVMGHVDHGKTKLLDYIRKSNIAESESGGITQHIGAYDVVYKGRQITFIDTPGHEAFSALRERGAHVADIAILVVAADEGIRPQTLEALEVIKKAGLPYMVAFNKMDKPDVNVMKVKQELGQNNVFFEGSGGNIPGVEVSAKTGSGIDDLLETLLLLAELEEIKGDPSAPASGVVIESYVDSRRGITATLLITNGTLLKNQVVVVGKALANVRILENFLGEAIESASLSSPVRVVGFSAVPQVGVVFKTFRNKQEALLYVPDLKVEELVQSPADSEKLDEERVRFVVPVVVKADVVGSLDAVVSQLDRFQSQSVRLHILKKGVGDVSEDDIQLFGVSKNGVVIAFRVGISKDARDVSRHLKITILEFDIIYNIEKDLVAFIKTIAQKISEEVEVGTALILKIFSKNSGKVLIGARVSGGEIKKGDQVDILRGEESVGVGRVFSLKIVKEEVEKVGEGKEFGAMIKTAVDLQSDDILSVTVKRPMTIGK